MIKLNAISAKKAATVVVNEWYVDLIDEQISTAVKNGKTSCYIMKSKFYAGIKKENFDLYIAAGYDVTHSENNYVMISWENAREGKAGKYIFHRYIG